MQCSVWETNCGISWDQFLVYLRSVLEEDKLEKFERAIVWLRRDLRLRDHHALCKACNEAKEVLLLFIFDPHILGSLDSDDRRMPFIWGSLEALREDLPKKNSLLLLHGTPLEVMVQLMERVSFDAVYCSTDYEPDAKKRDQSIEECLVQKGRAFFSVKDQVLFQKREVLSGSGEPYRVFTPYKKAWLGHLERTRLIRFDPNLEKLGSWPKGFQEVQTLSQLGFKEQVSPEPVGEASALKRWQEFRPRMKDYDQLRDFPVKDATSKLSIHLRFGTISIRQLAFETKRSATKGAEVFLSELIWREFYQMILDQYPNVVAEAFKPEYRDLKWPGKEEHFRKWCLGETGFPIVDAAMRHFNETGRMHNRLRMVVASFLVKDLLIDWRWGEAYFAKKLLDFDLSANNGGWQWSASTGCDAQPYFRIFNPFSQSKRFDGDGAFMKEQIPELKDVPAKALHDPEHLTRAKPKGYPLMIVDHKVMRDKALKLFKKGS